MHARGEEEGEGKGTVVASQRGPLGFLSPLQVGILGEVSREGFSRIFISFPGVLFQGCGLH